MNQRLGNVGGEWFGEPYLDPIEAAIEEIAAGGMAVVIDDPGRENEGDLLFAAEFADADKINWLATEGRGLICVAMLAERLERLEIPPMTAYSRDSQSTAFHVSVDASEGVGTGISAADRARTVAALADCSSRAGDFVRPGHIFPLAARDGGVLERPGHTEAGVELCRLAGLSEAAVICEVCSEDGEMARLPELRSFAHRHGLPLIAIADLIAYEMRLAPGRISEPGTLLGAGRETHEFN